jgi:predicted dienelactone hydrolase
MLLRFVFAALLAALSVAPAHADAGPPQAGFERTSTAAGVEVGIWYPATGEPVHQRLGLYAQDVVPGGDVPAGSYPLIVMSHGSGGDFSGHADTAAALARAGYIVAALTHPGDNWRDKSRATRVEDRPKALGALITYMLADWRGHKSIDPGRIGAFGFSAGGFTVLAAAGGRPELSRMAAHCAANPGFFDCRMVGAQPPAPASAPAITWPEKGDARIKAIVVAAPALGFTFDRAGLAGVAVPVQLWRADADRVLPAPFYADAVRAALPVPPEFHDVAGAGHFDFLMPCADPKTVPQICESAPGFDRAAFHTRFNAEVVRFFGATLRGR